MALFGLLNSGGCLGWANPERGSDDLDNITHQIGNKIYSTAKSKKVCAWIIGRNNISGNDGIYVYKTPNGNYFKVEYGACYDEDGALISKILRGGISPISKTIAIQYYQDSNYNVRYMTYEEAFDEQVIDA